MEDKIIKKLKRILLWVTALLLLVIGLAFVAATTPMVQTWLAHRVSAYLTKQLHTRVYVEKVRLKFFTSMELKKLFIGDQHQDTLLYAGALTVNFNDISTSKNILDIHNLELADGGFYLREYNGEDGSNLDFIIDYFSSADTSDTSSSKMKITVENVHLENVHFRYEVEADTIQEHGMDYEHIDIHHIFGDINNIHFINDSIFGVIQNLSAQERCGFVLTDFDGDAKLSSDEMRIRNLHIKTPYSDIHTNLTFNYDSFPDWSEFVERMQWNSNFVNSTISFTDIAFFADPLWGMNSSLRLSGDCKGTVSRFRCKNVTLQYGEHTVFKGNIGLTGLPDIEETYFDLLAEQITTNKKDLETIPLYPFDSVSHLKLPDNLAYLGMVNFKGKFSGFYNDFVAYGNMNTALGYVSSDINLKFNPAKKKEFYKGHLSAKDFNIGKLIDVKELSRVSLSADVDGSGLRIDNMETQMKGSISLLEFRGYPYHNITVNGQLSKKLFDGKLVIDEPNVGISFNGQVDLQDEIPYYDFSADITRLRLDKLNLIKLPGEAEISSSLEINFSGNKPDNWEGEIQINNFNYKADKVLYHINNISLASDLEATSRGIHIKSDFVDGDLKGQFQFNTLGNAFVQIVPDYFPALMPDYKKVVSNQDFVFDIHLKNTSLITEIFLPSWRIDPSTIVSGSFNSIMNKFDVKVESNEIKYKNFRLVNEALAIDANVEAITVQSVAERLYYTDSTFIETPMLDATAKMNVADFILRFADSAIYENKGYLDGNLIVESPSKFNLKFNQADITLNNKVWTLDPGNNLHIDSSAMVFKDLRFENADASMGLNGIISSNEQDTLYFGAENFRLEDLNAIFKKYGGLELGGVLNGKASVSNIYNKPLLLADLSIRSLALNGDTLGNAVILSGYDTRKKAVHLSMNVLKNDFKTIYIDGDYFTGRDEDNLDFTISLVNFYMAPYERYISSVVTEVRGKLSSELKLTGTFSKPRVNGTIDLSKSSCRVNYLNTVYTINDKVYVKENAFEFKNLIIRDSRGNTGKANGKIMHNYFSDFRFDIRLDVSKFEGLHTVASQNETYYGSAYVTGYAYFRGPIESMDMDMQLKTEKGTEIFIPLTSSSELSRSSYITFINKTDTTKLEEQRTQVNNSGITLDMRFEITNDASIEIIFDEKIGDKIKGIGTGNLNLTLDEAGNFNIFGSYFIDKGDYLFTLQNIINKKFTIAEGTIFWNGDPYNADINMTAYYKGGTSTLYKVMPEDSSLKRRLNYEVVLFLTNKLMNPTINYEINVFGLDNATAGTVYSRINSEAELTRQVFGLMLLNQFIPLPRGTEQVEGISAAEGAGSSAAELLSNQVSNWLSQNKYVSLGVNYRPADTYNKEELEVMFSKSLFNDRLSIEGNVGVASDQTTRNIVGDFNAEYALTPDGRVKLKAFNRSNVNNVLDYASPYTQGVGIFYHEQFNAWSDLWKRRKKNQKEESKSSTPGTIPSE